MGAFVVPAGLLMLVAPSPVAAQAPGAKAQATPKAGGAEESEKEAAPTAPDVGTDSDTDPSKTKRVAPVEVFKDPNAEAILDIKRLNPLSPAPFTNQDLLRVKEMASNPNLPADRTLIDRVVRGLAAQLTDRNSIQSLLEGPPEEAPKAEPAKKGAPVKKRTGDGGKGIQTATTNLLEPIFIARGIKNEAFLRDYRQSLHRHLPQLLKNHLIPRVQAMIVLGEAATPSQEALTLFQGEITNRSQALWVKLWALEGIANMKKHGSRLGAEAESKASRTIAEFLEKHQDLPWLLQLRALEAMGWLRQSGTAIEATRAQMANTAMLFLADPEAKFEVRAEAARALGLMQVNAVPNFNFRLVAHAAGMLAADIAEAINDQYADSPPKAENPTKARYLAALLVGPVYECFDGVQGESNSGILQTGRADANAAKYIQKVFDLLRPMAQAAIDLLGSPSKEFKARKKTLAARIAEMRQFLAQNPPPSRNLVPNGKEFGSGGAQQAGARVGGPGPAVAGFGRGR